MNAKRLFRGPWVWIVLILVLVVVTLQFSGRADGFKEVRTATMVGYLDDGTISEMTFVEGDQEIQATLDDGTKVRAKFLAGQGDRLVEKAE
ncbi:ATP-dependent metallopeptidase FtsH/Yme1/Tma family protein, partial [Aeromicrobium sp. Leaf272]